MKRQHFFKQPLILHLSVLYLILGLFPTVLLVIAPISYVLTKGSDWVGNYLHVVWAIQGGVFLAVVLVGATVTLRNLALPVQHLIAGASALAEGNLSYRVPETHGTEELRELTHNFNAMAESVERLRDHIEEQRLELENTVAQREHEFEIILEIASLVNSPDDPLSTTARALKIARTALGTDHISLVLLDENREITSTSFACCDCPGEKRYPNQGLPCLENCKTHQLLRRCAYRMHNNLLQETINRGEKIRVYEDESGVDLESTGVQEVLDELGIHMSSLVPLTSHGRTLGVVILMRKNRISIPQQSLTLLDTLMQNIAVLIENGQLQDKARTLTIMQERSHLARELHDSVTQSLFTLSLTARGLQSSLGNISGNHQQALNMLIEQTRVVQTDMRSLINTLRPVDLEADDLESALREHIHSFRRSSNADVKLTVKGNVRSVSKPVQQNLNRIAQEALSNIARHTNAENVAIKLEVTHDMASLVIEDNGCGFDPRIVILNQRDSLGLTSMRERAEMLGGALMVRSNPCGGTSITAQIPLQHEMEIA